MQVIWYEVAQDVLSRCTTVDEVQALAEKVTALGHHARTLGNAQTERLAAQLVAKAEQHAAHLPCGRQMGQLRVPRLHVNHRPQPGERTEEGAADADEVFVSYLRVSAAA